MKFCTKCKQSKTDPEFYKSYDSKRWCRKCQNLSRRQYALRNKDKINEYNRKQRQLDVGTYSKSYMKTFRTNLRQTQPLKVRAWTLHNTVVSRTKSDKRGGDPEYFTTEYFLNVLTQQKYCPSCNVEFEISYKDDRTKNGRVPSIDRFDPTKGYFKDNVMIICWRCNSLKKDATSTELRAIADWMNDMICERNIKVFKNEKYHILK